MGDRQKLTDRLIICGSDDPGDPAVSYDYFSRFAMAARIVRLNFARRIKIGVSETRASILPSARCSSLSSYIVKTTSIVLAAIYSRPAIMRLDRKVSSDQRG